MKSSELKKLIGKKIFWDDFLDPNRGTFKIRNAKVVAIHGRNIETEDTTLWAPDLKNLRTVARSPLQ